MPLGSEGAGQSRGREDLFDGVLGRDHGDEAERSFAARADRVDLERPEEKLAPRNVVSCLLLTT
jgi:hypothetical protein